jgi:hypothetical protein
MKSLKLITIFNSPDDFPGEFIAREFHILKEGIKPGEIVMRGKNLFLIRKHLESLNLFPVARQDNDLPSVVESWI